MGQLHGKEAENILALTGGKVLSNKTKLNEIPLGQKITLFDVTESIVL